MRGRFPGVLVVFLPLALPLALASAAAGQPTPPAPEEGLTLPAALDLEAVVDLALERNPALKAVEERRSEVEAGIREAVASAFPELALVTSWSRSRNPSLLNSPDFEEFLNQFPGGTFVPREQELYSIALEVRQALYTSGKTGAAIELARIVADAADAQIRAARLSTALTAAEAYYRLLSTRRSLATVEIQRRVREESLAVVEARYELGDATRLELLRARSALAEVEPEVARIRGEVQIAEQELRVVLGLPSGLPLAVAEEDGEPISPPALSELVSAAMEVRPELADLALQQEALGKQQEITQAEGRPQLDLVGSYGRQSRLPENLSDNLYQDWRVALSMRWELFDGGERRGRIAGLESQRRQLAWQRRDLVNNIVLEIERARTEYSTARERWRSAEVAADAAREASRVAEETYREGVALQADLLDAQQREILAELTRVEAYYDTLTEAARLERAVGRLPGAGLEPSPGTSPPPPVDPAAGEEEAP